MDGYASEGASQKAGQFESFGQRPEPEPSDTRISAQIEFMGDQIDKLHGMLNVLEERLDYILLPDFPIDRDVALKMAEPAPSSRLSSVLDTHNSRLSNLQYRIDSIQKRVQI